MQSVKLFATSVYKSNSGTGQNWSASGKSGSLKQKLSECLLGALDVCLKLMHGTDCLWDMKDCCIICVNMQSGCRNSFCDYIALPCIGVFWCSGEKAVWKSLQRVGKGSRGTSENWAGCLCFKSGYWKSKLNLLYLLLLEYYGYARVRRGQGLDWIWLSWTKNYSPDMQDQTELWWHSKFENSHIFRHPADLSLSRLMAL